jgi:predicted regulator of Ras-like GTPase activity (Roadblock/LC7/MglB family)
VSQRPHAETSKPARDGVIGAARVHPSGEILSSRGEVGAELAGLAAYVARLADLVGEFFGTGRVRAIDARMAQTRSVVKRESDASITTVLASTSQSQAQELTSHAIDWGLPEPTVVHLLSGLRDVEGVVGSFLVAPSGASIGVDLPQVFDADVVAEATDRLTRARDGFEARGDRLRSLELRFAQQRLYLTCIDAGFLGVLHVGPANVPLLSMATQVVLRKLSAPPGTIPSRLGTSATVTPPAEPRTATAATPRPKPRANSVPGAPAAGGGRPKRPVYFRGRLVNSD